MTFDQRLANITVPVVRG